MVKRVHYDPEADILYILLREGPVEDTIEVAEDVFRARRERRDNRHRNLACNEKHTRTTNTGRHSKIRTTA